MNKRCRIANYVSNKKFLKIPAETGYCLSAELVLHKLILKLSELSLSFPTIQAKQPIVKRDSATPGPPGATYNTEAKSYGTRSARVRLKTK